MADPDPMTCDPGSPVYDPDPGTVIPDPIYLVTTLLCTIAFWRMIGIVIQDGAKLLVEMNGLRNNSAKCPPS